ncbi:MAG TPA: aromatic ring-hydroxylating dioxygenase subunit alpha [Pseudolabrys sp.]|nr:aromatic ring-hydroxylating dioxygenase subunit alpha [Pseudolabrys sp.]
MNEITQTQFVGDTTRLRPNVNILDRLQPAFYQREIERIFKRSWLPVASLSDVPEKNCFVVADVPPLNTSLIVARGPDLKVRAFYNICRHRGARLVKTSRGCRAAMTCGFHGWTFATDGRLIGLTDKTQFDDIDPNELGLIPVHTEVWEDYVFVNFEEKPTQTLEQWLGKFHGEYPGFFSNRPRIADYRIEVAANWNIAINSFSEGYHAAYVHRKTVPDYQGGQKNPLRHRAYLELTERHGRYSAQANPNRRRTPVEQIAYGRGRELYPAFPEYTPETLPLPIGVNNSRNQYWGFDVVELFPVLIILIGAHWHANLWFWPVSEDRTDVRVQFHAYKAQTIGDHLAHAYFRARLREVFREDVGTMEQVTGVLKSGAMANIVLSKQELLLQQHYAVADTMVGQNAAR